MTILECILNVRDDLVSKKHVLLADTLLFVNHTDHALDLHEFLLALRRLKVDGVACPDVLVELALLQLQCLSVVLQINKISKVFLSLALVLPLALSFLLI
jgi:hypothetical protein